MRFTKTLFTTALFGASVFSFQSTAWAIEQNQMIQVEQLYKQKDFKAMLAILQPLAEQGDAIAQFLLGGMYEEGRGVKQDDVEAVKWYRKAAEQGYADAQALLGFAYLLGKGVQFNKSLAKEWLGKACDNGHQAGCEYYGKLNRGEL
ncbi:sel1 repeat family protein [Haemophilus influenzae]|nr:sel1 repeat family protein [Haemophilus influenzae]